MNLRQQIHSYRKQIHAYEPKQIHAYEPKPSDLKTQKLWYWTSLILVSNLSFLKQIATYILINTKQDQDASSLKRW